MLDNVFEKFRSLDAFKDYFDEATQIFESIFHKLSGYDWKSVMGKLG